MSYHNNDIFLHRNPPKPFMLSQKRLNENENMNNAKHETYCDYNLTNLLVKSGFDWKDYFIAHSIDEHLHWEIPLHIAQRWLREVKNYYVSIKVVEADFDSIGVFYSVSYIFHNGNNYNASYIWEKDENGEDNHRRLKIFNTYEEALEEGVKKALKLLLEKGE